MNEHKAEKAMEDAMNGMKKALSALTLALALWTWGAQTARAATYTNPAYLDLLVTFTGQLSVKVDGIQYSSRTISGGSDQHLVAGTDFSSSSVKNDGTVTERWQLSVATVSGGGNWAVSPTTSTASLGLDTYSLQALFVSSAVASGCPPDANADWNTFKSTVTGTATTYTSTMYADTSASFGSNNGSGAPDSASPNPGEMFVNAASGVGLRGLCTRLILPGSVTVGTQQVIRLTITAIGA